MLRSCSFLSLILGIALIALISVSLYYTHYLGLPGELHHQPGSVSDAGNNSSPMTHLALIMDGNRRWARERSMAAWQGHAAGVEPVKTAVSFCMQEGIPHLSLYVFSLENFNRPSQELSYLFEVLAQQVAHDDLQKLYDEGVRVDFIGDRTKFPTQLQSTIAHVEEKTAGGSKLHLHLLFCYGGQQDIAQATQRLAQDIAQGTCKADNITPDHLRPYLWTGHMPPPDLIVRTGKSQRLSNFLTFDAAYSELLFLDCFWPEITHQHLRDAVDTYKTRRRTFGA